MAAHLSNFDRWRLSRIAEENDAQSFSSPDDTSSSEHSRGSRDSTLEWKSRQGGSEPGPRGGQSIALTMDSLSSLKRQSPPTENIYSNKTLIELEKNDTGGFVCPERDVNCQGKDALRFIKEKYDSLGKVKVKKPSGAYSVQTLESMQLNGETAVVSGNVSYSMVGNDHNSLRRINLGSVASLASSGGNKTAIVSPTLSWSDKELSAGMSPLSGGVHPLFNHSSGLGCVSNPQHSVIDSVKSDQILGESRSSESRSSKSRSSEAVLLRPVSVTSQDILQVEMFYNSHKTMVSVCPCLAGLYVGTIKSLAAPPPPTTTAGLTHHHLISSSASKNDWVFVKSGLPVLILDSAESHRGRKLNVVIAEKGTGFSLWRDTVDQLSDYAVRSSTFHTMRLSIDSHRVVGLSFDDPNSAAEFLRNLQRLSLESFKSNNESVPTSHQNDHKKSSKKKSSKNESEAKPKGRLSKAAISQPCCFTHVTKLDGRDMAMVLRPDGLLPQGMQVTDDRSVSRVLRQVDDRRTGEHGPSRAKHFDVL